MNSEGYISLLEKHEAAPVRFLENVVWDTADGYRIRDVDGNAYIDFSSGAMITNSGHNNQAIIQAITDQLNTGIYSTYLFPNKPRVNLHELLSRIAPEDYQTVLLNTGSEGIEMALKMVRIYATKVRANKGLVVSFKNSYHGKLLASTAIGGTDALKYWIPENIQSELSVQVPFPNCEYEPRRYSFADTLAHVKANGVDIDDVAAFLIEPYQGGSCSFVPESYARDMAEFCRANKILLVCDEVQSGVGRTGEMWAYEHLGIVPDIFVAAKGVAASLPLSAVFARRDLFGLCELGSFNTTHSGNPVCCAAAIANINYVLDNGLVERAREMGELLHRKLKEIQSRYPFFVSHVLGKGLAQSIHLNQDYKHLLKDVLKAFLGNGLLVVSPGGAGGTTFKLVPPLIIDEEGIESGCRIIEQSLAQVISDNSLDPGPDDTLQISRDIYTILDKYRKNPHGLNYDGAHIIDQLESFVAKNKTITCLFPACHGKIDHPDLLVDHRADLSEYLCIEQLATMNDEIRSIYPPGLDVFMVHEGHFYVDTGLIRSDETMDEYLDDVRRLTSRHPFIHSLSLREFFPEQDSAADARAAFLDEYCPRDVDSEKYADMISYYAERIRNLFHDTGFRAYGGYATFDEFVDGKALEQLVIWIGFRRMLADRFGASDEHIRFSSVYKSPEVCEQIALNYVPEHHMEMPSFYSVCKRADGGYSYLTMSDALERNYRIAEVQGYRFFEPATNDGIPESAAERITEILEKYRKNPFGEVFDNSKIKAKVSALVQTGQPIPLVLPGFHGKTNNPDFVFGPSVDLGERVALNHLIGLLDEINAVYPPGAVLHITHECHFYVGRSPLVGSQEEVDSYLRDFRAMIGNRADVRSISVYEMIEQGTTLEDKLERFVADYCPSAEEVQARLEASPHHLRLYTSYKKVNQMHQRRDPAFVASSAKARKLRVKELATIQMQIYFGFGALVKSYFEGMDYIRLSSLYKGPEFTDCVAINYLPGLHHMSTPTFHCLVRRLDGTFDFIRKEDAHDKNYKISEEDGLKYFVAVAA